MILGSGLAVVPTGWGNVRIIPLYMQLSTQFACFKRDFLGLTCLLCMEVCMLTVLDAEGRSSRWLPQASLVEGEVEVACSWLRRMAREAARVEQRLFSDCLAVVVGGFETP